MKLKNYVLMNEDFIKLLGEFTSYKIKPTVAFTLLKLVKEMNVEKQNIDESRNALIKKHGTEKDGSFSIDKDDKEVIETFMKEYNEILKLDFELSITDKIDIECDKIFSLDKNSGKWESVYLTIGEVSLLSEIFNFV